MKTVSCIKESLIVPKLRMFPCLFLAKEAPLEPCKGLPKLSMTSHLLCFVGKTIWKLSSVVTPIVSALGLWREDPLHDSLSPKNPNTGRD